jgi:hypothetical protein
MFVFQRHSMAFGLDFDQGNLLAFRQAHTNQRCDRDC